MKWHWVIIIDYDGIQNFIHYHRDDPSDNDDHVPKHPKHVDDKNANGGHDDDYYYDDNK